MLLKVSLARDCAHQDRPFPCAGPGSTGDFDKKGHSSCVSHGLREDACVPITHSTAFAPKLAKLRIMEQYFFSDEWGVSLHDINRCAAHSKVAVGYAHCS